MVDGEIVWKKREAKIEVSCYDGGLKVESLIDWIRKM